MLWNGSLTEEFYPSHCLIQRDSLSPYLFVLCIKRLGHLIQDAFEDGRWKPLRLSRGGLVLTHLFFADDLFLFGETDMAQVEVINSVLDMFSEYSSQRVNKRKSQNCFSSNVPIDIMNAISNSMGFERVEELGVYLGMPFIS